MAPYLLQDTLTSAPKDHITEMNVFHEPYKVYTHRYSSRFYYLEVIQLSECLIDIHVRGSNKEIICNACLMRVYLTVT